VGGHEEKEKGGREELHKKKTTGLSQKGQRGTKTKKIDRKRAKTGVLG